MLVPASEKFADDGPPQRGRGTVEQIEHLGVHHPVAPNVGDHEIEHWFADVEAFFQCPLTELVEHVEFDKVGGQFDGSRKISPATELLTRERPGGHRGGSAKDY